MTPQGAAMLFLIMLGIAGLNVALLFRLWRDGRRRRRELRAHAHHPVDNVPT